MRKGIKTLIISWLAITMLMGTVLTAADVSFVNYDSSNGYKSIYNTNPLGCNYASSLEQKVNNYGKDWVMKSAVTSHGLDYNGEYVINGYSKLTSKSWITGFTGATFINVKDANGQEMYLASVKTQNPIATVNVSTDQSEAISWGVNPGKLKLYVAGYKYKKVLWWKVKIPVIKSKVVAKTRTVNWSIKLPKYVIDRDIKIELINAHTPTQRVLAALQDTGQKVSSFVLANGMQTKALYEKAQNKELKYGDVEEYINGVLAWAEVQQLITPAKSQNITNIMAEVHNIINNSPDGFLPKNQDALVAIAFNLTSIISDKQVNPQAINSLINQIEIVCQDKSGFVPENLQSIENILVNLKGLLEPYMSDKQEGIYDNIVGIIAVVNDWNQVALSDHQDVVFNGMRLVVNLYDQINAGTISASQAEVVINDWLDDLGIVVYTELPQYTEQFNNFRTNVVTNIFNILIFLEGRDWI